MLRSSVPAIKAKVGIVIHHPHLQYPQVPFNPFRIRKEINDDAAPKAPLSRFVALPNKCRLLNQPLAVTSHDSNSYGDDMASASSHSTTERNPA